MQLWHKKKKMCKKSPQRQALLFMPRSLKLSAFQHKSGTGGFDALQKPGAMLARHVMFRFRTCQKISGKTRRKIGKIGKLTETLHRKMKVNSKGEGEFITVRDNCDDCEIP